MRYHADPPEELFEGYEEYGVRSCCADSGSESAQQYFFYEIYEILEFSENYLYKRYFP